MKRRWKPFLFSLCLKQIDICSHFKMCYEIIFFLQIFVSVVFTYMELSSKFYLIGKDYCVSRNYWPILYSILTIKIGSLLPGHIVEWTLGPKYESGHKSDFLPPKIPIFLHACATCSELPSAVPCLHLTSISCILASWIKNNAVHI